MLTSLELVAIRECVVDIEAVLGSCSETTLILIKSNVQQVLSLLIHFFPNIL